MSTSREQEAELANIYIETLNRGHGMITRFEQGNRAAEKILAAGYRKPKVITTIEALDALPHHALIHTADGDHAERVYDQWFIPGVNHAYHSRTIQLPATVLWEPTE